MTSVKGHGEGSLLMLALLALVAGLLAGLVGASGPMRFRFVLEPLMATIVAIRDGLTDLAARHISQQCWVIRGNAQDGCERDLNATARITALGLVMDVIYQAIVFKTFYPDQALVVALVLAFVPYLIIRSVIARIWRSQPPA